MRILLINPPNCGRSIPEERYGITSIKQIFRGEPLGLEELAGNLPEHEVRLLDLKVEPDGLADRTRGVPARAGRHHRSHLRGQQHAADWRPRSRRGWRPRSWSAASMPATTRSSSINPRSISLFAGLGKRSFAQLIDQLEQQTEPSLPAGVCRTTPGRPLTLSPHRQHPRGHGRATSRRPTTWSRSIATATSSSGSASAGLCRLGLRLPVGLLLLRHPRPDRRQLSDPRCSRR